jgi:hypothetical protein
MIVQERTATYVRPGTARDLEAVRLLFSPPKRRELVQWLLGDKDGGLRSFVAVENGEIVGHVGYTVSTFGVGSSQRTGVYPILWKVREGSTGGAGLQLLGRVLPLGDFSFIMGGSAAAQRLYRVFGYRKLFEVPTYQKVLNLRGLGSNLLSRRAGRAFRMRISALFSKADGHGVTSKAVRLVPLQDVSPDNSHRTSDRVVQNLVSADHLQWALGCPEVSAYGFALTVDGITAGSVICYIRRSWGGLLGTVVYIPYLGADPEVWSGTFRQIEGWLAREGCSRVTVMASSEICAEALVRCGFVADRLLPFWCRSRAEFPEDWHLTFLEGDLGYRK